MLKRMKAVMALLFLLVSVDTYGQITVDTTDPIVVVKEKTATISRSLSIYNAYEQSRGKCNIIVYEPNSGDYGVDPDTLYLNFSNELTHVKVMLDAALKLKKSYNFYRFACSMAPYRDVAAKLADVYAASPQWNEYLKKTPNLKVADTLFDGNELVEIRYDRLLAASVLDKSDFAKVLDDFFRPYGYKMSGTDFPSEHQQTLSRNELRSVGKPETLIVPVPTNYFILTKIGGAQAPKPVKK